MVYDNFMVNIRIFVIGNYNIISYRIPNISMLYNLHIPTCSVELLYIYFIYNIQLLKI